MTSKRGFRAVALAVALSTTASGSGLPMCVTLLAQSVAPCAMHRHPSGGAVRYSQHQGPQVVAHPVAMSCHPDDATPGCAAGGGCPASGTAAPAFAARAVVLDRPSGALDWAPAFRPPSFLAPPLPPPPQA